MTIYLDVSAAVHARAGLGRYAESLIRGLNDRYPGRWGLFYNADRATRPLAGLGPVPVRTVRAGYKPWRAAVYLGQRAGLGFDRLVPNAELFHATEHLLLPLRHTPTVLTVHDLIFHLFPKHHKRLNYWFLNLSVPLFCRRADAIIAISRSTRDDLVREYRVDRTKISVIYEAAAPHFRPAGRERIESVRAKHGLPDRYALHVGTIEPRKNLVRLVEAVDRLRRSGQAVTLALVGAKGWLYEGFFRRLDDLGLDDSVRVLGYVPDDDLAALYSGAAVCVVPSLYEGFGLPVLEAMACGAPVACSRTSSLPELAGDSAVYFSPESVDNMAAALGRVLADDELRHSLAKSGLARAAEFSWERTAEHTMALYERVIAQAAR